MKKNYSKPLEKIKLNNQNSKNSKNNKNQNT